MNSNEKLVILNNAAQALKILLEQIKEVFTDDKDIGHHIWRVNKEIHELHKSICKKLETEITDDEFYKIIKKLRGDQT